MLGIPSTVPKNLGFLVNSLHFQFEKSCHFMGIQLRDKAILTFIIFLQWNPKNIPARTWKRCSLKVGSESFFCRVVGDDVLLQLFEMETDGTGNELSKHVKVMMFRFHVNVMGDTVDGRNPKQPPGMYRTL